MTKSPDTTRNPHVIAARSAVAHVIPDKKKAIKWHRRLKHRQMQFNIHSY